MTSFDIKSWSERQQVLAIILMAGLLIAVASYFVLLPLNRQRWSLEGEIEGMRQQLQQKKYLIGEDALRREKKNEEDGYRLLHGEWTNMAARLGGFGRHERVARFDFTRIDFKVRLGEVRERLLGKAESLGIRLPPELGMDAEVTSNEDARTLILQLLAVEKLVDTALNVKIGQVRHLSALTPIKHEPPGGKGVFLEEYPVRMEFDASLDNLYDVFNAIFDRDQVFVLKHIRVSPSVPRPTLLSIDAVLSAMLFVKDPTELAPAPKKALAPVRMGH